MNREIARPRGRRAVFDQHSVISLLKASEDQIIKMPHTKPSSWAVQGNAAHWVSYRGKAQKLIVVIFKCCGNDSIYGALSGKIRPCKNGGHAESKHHSSPSTPSAFYGSHA